MTQQLNQLLSFLTQEIIHLEVLFRAILGCGPQRLRNNLFSINMVREIKKKDRAPWPDPVNLAGNQMQNLVSAFVATFSEATA